MHHGNHTNPEIEQLIASGTVSYWDTVYSTTWDQTLRFNGVVFMSICSCSYVGHYAPCGQEESNQTGCDMVEETVGSFDPDFEP
jgi:hypothetical protein